MTKKMKIIAAIILIPASVFFIYRTVKISTLKGVITQSLKDPDSAVFRNVSFKLKKNALCGEINAKNSYGAYIGFKPFVATKYSAKIFNGNDCNLGSYSSQSECLQEQNAYLEFALDNQCITSQ